MSVVSSIRTRHLEVAGTSELCSTKVAGPLSLYERLYTFGDVVLLRSWHSFVFTQAIFCGSQLKLLNVSESTDGAVPEGPIIIHVANSKTFDGLYAVNVAQDVCVAGTLRLDRYAAENEALIPEGQWPAHACTRSGVVVKAVNVCHIDADFLGPAGVGKLTLGAGGDTATELPIGQSFSAPVAGPKVQHIGRVEGESRTMLSDLVVVHSPGSVDTAASAVEGSSHRILNRSPAVIPIHVTEGEPLMVLHPGCHALITYMGEGYWIV